MRVALNIEQLLHRPPGGIGRYTAELLRLVPEPETGPRSGSGSDGERIEIVPFVARHRRAAVATALGAFGIADTEVVRLFLPRPVLYDTWNTGGMPPLGLLHRDLRNIDLVHAPSLAIPPGSGVPLIVTVHDAAALVFPETYTRRGRWFHARGSAAAARRADVVIAPTHAAAVEIAEHTPIPFERMQVVPHGVAQHVVGEGVVAATRQTVGIGDEPYVLWVGTLEPRKNLPVLVEAFRAVVAAADLPHRLVLVGPQGWLDEADAVRDDARELGDHIHFTGPVRADRLVALYRGADLLAFPSLHEGFGLPILEAMAQSTAVLCSDIPVLREVAGDAAEFVPPRDVAHWGDALVTLLRDDAARSRLAARGRARAAQFTWERCADRTRAVYRELLGRTEPARR
jgi:glycosyltransferase involved in cell wall biosynthesis